MYNYDVNQTYKANQICEGGLTMKKFARLFTAVVLVLALAAMMTACGKESKEPAQGQDQPKEVVYKVGTEPSFAPFEMLDEKTGEITGFDIDLIKAIAEDQGLKLEIVNLGFDGLIPALQTGNIDIVASGMSITEERLKEVDFSDPYIDAGLAIAVTANNTTINGAEDLKGKVVAVQIGTTGAQKAQELKDQGLIKEIKTYNTVDVVIMELVNGGVDAIINDKPVTEAFMAKQPGKIKIVGETLVSDSYGFAVKKGNSELLSKINAGLKNVKESGKFDEIMKKYF